MKTSELTGAALDWAVAKSEGEDYSPITTYSGIGQDFPPTTYSTNWAQGGPIIEREKIDVLSQAGLGWLAVSCKGEISGETPLIAAMRCYVASKLGDDIEIPEGLQ